MSRRRNERHPASSLLLALATALAACGGGGLDDLQRADSPVTTDQPGAEAWQRTRNIDDPTCETDDDCLTGEACIDGICQMQRCTTYGDSLAPLGDAYTFFWDRELVVADASLYDGAHWLDGYAPSAEALGYQSSWSLGAGTVADVTGGNLIPEGTEELAVVEAGSNTLSVLDGETSLTTDPFPFAPLAVASGDLDHDGRDELVTVGTNGGLALCSVSGGTISCETFRIDGVTLLDVTAGDVDDDGYDEAILLMESSGTRLFYVLNTDTEETGQDEVLTTVAPVGIARIAAGDIDGDAIDEILALEDGALSGASDDGLLLFEFDGANLVLVDSMRVAADAADITAGNLGLAGASDIREQLVLLRMGRAVDVYGDDGEGGLGFSFSAPLGITQSPTRLALADFDGDSPRGKLVEGPIPTPGRVVPMMVLQLPPYDREYSAGGSSVGVSSGSSQGESRSEGLSLSMGVSLGVGTQLFGLFSSGMSYSMGKSISRSHGVSSSLSIGASYGIGADPETYGANQASVVLSAGCFLNFIYEMEDPKAKLGGSGERISLLVPVGGQTTLWDLRRYNAMARAVGDLPVIETQGFRSGELDTYPASPSLPDGSPIPAEDLVFPNPPSFIVSDMGSTSWSVSIGEGESNGVSLSSSVGSSVSTGLFGFSYGRSAGEGWSQSYGISIGKSTSFSGSVPAIPNDPETPEDEYLLNRYSFRPFVYRQHYTASDGSDAAYYVISYTVGD